MYYQYKYCEIDGKPSAYPDAPGVKEKLKKKYGERIKFKEKGGMK